MDNFDEKDYNLWVLIRQTRDVLLRIRENELRQHGITARQSATLITIQYLGNKATIGQISDWLLREHHSVSSIVSRMESSGLVRKIRDKRNRSEVNVTLTAKGYQAYKNAIKRDSIRKVMSFLSTEQRQQMASLLMLLRDKAIEELRLGSKPPFPPPDSY